MSRRVTIVTNLCIFQYKILNNFLYLNEKYFRFKFVSLPVCSFCNSEDETPLHLFDSCNQTKSLQSKFQELLYSEKFLPQNTPLSAFFVFFQIINKILKLLTICILYLSIILFNTKDTRKINLEGLKKTIINVLLITHDAGYILYSLPVFKLSSQMNIAMKKVLYWQLTAQIWPNNFTKTLRSFLFKDNPYQFTASV